MSTKKMKKVVKQYLLQDKPVVLKLANDYVELSLYGYKGIITLDFDSGFGADACYEEEDFKSIEKLIGSLSEMRDYMHAWNAKNKKENGNE